MSARWFLCSLPALSAFAGFIEADNLLFGQWMVSRPVVVGPLFGFLLGDLWIGVLFGGLFEAFCGEESPVGSAIPMSGHAGTVCSVLLAAGQARIPSGAAFPAGLLCAVAAARMDTALREWRGRFSAEAEASLVESGRIPWRLLLARSIGVHFAATAALIYAAGASAPILGLALGLAPRALQNGLANAFGWSVWLGLAVLLHAMARRS
jgi:mannose/fructose/N-acetylgalactosamine-specific phosphotransferase system component IIC